MTEFEPLTGNIYKETFWDQGKQYTNYTQTTMLIVLNVGLKLVQTGLGLGTP